MQFAQSAHFPSQTGSAVRPRLDGPEQQLSGPSPGFSDSLCSFLVCFVSVSLTGVLDPRGQGCPVLCSCGCSGVQIGTVPGERRNLCPWC